MSGIVIGTKAIAVNKRSLSSWSMYLGEIGDKKRLKNMQYINQYENQGGKSREWG